MQNDLANLSRQALVKQTSTMDSDLSPVRAVTLTKEGHRALSYSRFLRPDQVTYHGLKKPKEAFHDAELYRLYHKVSDEIEDHGGKVVRVKLDYEIKRDLYADLGRTWQDRSKCPETVKEAVARRHGLKVVNKEIQIPDMRLEYANDPDMEIHTRDVELAIEHSTARSVLRNGLVYHLSSRIVYRAIDRENLRNRRAHSLEHIRTRLVALDFVLAHLQHEYLETEDDKLNYFCQQLDIPKELLPRKRYSGAVHNRTRSEERRVGKECRARRAKGHSR